MIGCSCVASGFRMPTRVPSARTATGPCPRSGSGGTKEETVYALVVPSQGVYVVADDLHIVNDHLRIPICHGIRLQSLSRPTPQLSLCRSFRTSSNRPEPRPKARDTAGAFRSRLCAPMPALKILLLESIHPIADELLEGKGFE